MALYNKLENPEVLPDYSEVPHGSVVELIPVPVLEEVYYVVERGERKRPEQQLPATEIPFS